MTWTGLTWDHPRGYNALAAAAAADPVIAWSRQPLEGFEAHPIGELCATYDIVVLDHPHIGEAVAEACLQPLDTLFSADEITAWASATIGPCMASYRYGGRYWALPLDAATQVMARRADLVDGPAPQTWDEVAALAGRVPVCLSLAGPHAALSFMSIAVALGEPPAARDPERLLSDETARAAFALMTQIDATAPAFTRALNPIGLLAAMAGGNDHALCPLVYGYVNYAAPRLAGQHSVTFSDAPAAVPGGRPGTTLGGTGIAFSRHCRPAPALLDHVRRLMGAEMQTGFIPAHDGQPSRREAWTSPAVDRAWGGFYGGTARSLEQAWVRPRHPGYIAFQAAASALIREALAGDGRDLPARLQDAYAASRRAGGEI